MEGLWGLQGVMREKHNRDLTNLDLGGRVWEIWGVVWWENVCNLFNNFQMLSKHTILPQKVLIYNRHLLLYASIVEI